MSDFLEKEQNTLEPELDTAAVESDSTDEVFSTIFSAPAEHNDKPSKRSNKRRLTSVIAACLAVAILIGGTVAVIRLIPKMQEEEAPQSVFEDITVLETNSKLFSTVTVTNKNGEFKFIKQQISSTDEDGKTETTDYWGVEGIDISKFSSSTINSLISSAAEVIALREVGGKNPSECGFDTPQIKVAVTAEGQDPYTILVGDASPDNLGSYLKIDGVDIIYVVENSEFSSFDFTLTDLADKTSIPATVFTADTSDNKAEDGAYAYFDSLTVSGKLFPETITIVNNTENTDSAALVPYLITTPINRYANSDNLTSLINLFSNEISVSGNYAFDINDQTLKEFGLDNPDAIITMTIEGEAKTFKLNKIDDEYCAIIYDGATMIRKSMLANFAFMSLKPENFYMSNLFLHSINDVTNLKMTTADSEAQFDISYKESEGDSSKKTYTIKSGDKTLVTEDFQSFYSDFVTIQCSDFTVDNISAESECTVVFTFNDDSKSVIKFYKANDTQYQYSVDDIPMGKITSSAFNKMVKEFNDTAAGK